MAGQIGSTWGATYQPSTVLLAALEHISQVKRQDAELKREIKVLVSSLSIDYELARTAVLASRGLLRQP